MCDSYSMHDITTPKDLSDQVHSWVLTRSAASSSTWSASHKILQEIYSNLALSICNNLAEQIMSRYLMGPRKQGTSAESADTVRKEDAQSKIYSLVSVDVVVLNNYRNNWLQAVAQARKEYHSSSSGSQVLQVHSFLTTSRIKLVQDADSINVKALPLVCAWQFAQVAWRTRSWRDHRISDERHSFEMFVSSCLAVILD